MLARVIGVFKLDSKTFEEIEHNTSLTLYAAHHRRPSFAGERRGHWLVQRYYCKQFFSGSVVGGFFGSVFSTFIRLVYLVSRYLVRWHHACSMVRLTID